MCYNARAGTKNGCCLKTKEKEIVMPTHEDWNRLVNSKWSALGNIPDPTPEEAISGVKRLYRKAMGRPWGSKIKVTSGNRHTWVRRGVLFVNPEEGWREIVHLIAHYADMRLNPTTRPHSSKELYLERDLTDFAIAKGFHLGALRPKQKPAIDKAAVTYERLLKRERAWNSKLKRAQNALRKIKRSIERHKRKQSMI